jgi:hypothetical protein
MEAPADLALRFDDLFSYRKRPHCGRKLTCLESYLQFATSKINVFLNSVKANVDPGRWTPDASIKNRLITVTYINSFLITLRFLIRDGRELEFDALKASLSGVGSFPFKDYHSSQYARMAEKIYEKHFPQ